MSHAAYSRMAAFGAILAATVAFAAQESPQQTGSGSQITDHPDATVVGITDRPDQPFVGGAGPGIERVRPHFRSTYDLIPELYPEWSKPRIKKHDPVPGGPFPSSTGPIQVDESGGPEIAAPNLLRNWNSVGPNGWIPPDPDIAVGPHNVVVVTNDDWAIYNKKGDLLFQVDFNDWLNDSRFLFDPVCFYDNHSQRFVICILQRDDTNFTSNWVVMVSDDNNALGSWWWYYFNARLDGSNNTNNWADYPSIGYDDVGAVYLTANQFAWGGGFQYSKVRRLLKSEIYNAQAAGWYDFWNMNDDAGTKTHTLRAAQSHSYPGMGLLINSNRVSGDYVVVWKITNPTGTPSLAGTKVTVVSYSAPPDGDQPDTTTNIDNIDARLLNAEYYVNHIYTAHSVAYDWGSGNRAVIKYYKIYTPGTPSVVWDERWGASGLDYYYPAVSVNNLNDMAVVFARSGSEYAGIRYSGRRSSDSTMQGSALLKSGAGAYTGGRWGDYFGIGLDPSDAQTFWIYGQYAMSGNTWGTWIGEVNFDKTADASPPTFSNFSPTQTTDTTPNISANVQDVGWSGLDTTSATYRYSTNGGTTYSSWLALNCTGSQGTTGVQTVSANSIPFNQDSLTQNRIQLRIEDMSSNSTTATYTVQIDGTAPTPWGSVSPAQSTTQTPTLSITIRDATSGLNVASGQYWYSRDGGNTYFGPFTATCTGSNGTTATQTVTASNVPFNQDSLTQNAIWFYIEDMFGTASGTGWLNHPVDATAPGSWANFQPAGAVNGGSQTCSVQVRDLTSGLNVGSAQYRFSTNSGGTWSAWTAAACSGSNGTTAVQTITAANVPFDTAGNTNRIQFRIQDMFGNVGTSGAYTVTIDKLSLVLGRVVLNDYVGSLTGIPLTIMLYDGAALVETQVTPLNATGNYSVWFANKGGTLVRVKTPTHLTESVATSLSSLVPNTLNWTMRYNGDGDGDNNITLADLNKVLVNFGGGGADYNGSGVTDLPDLNVVLVNFGKVGS
ncbi:MAG: hypothetical protein HRF45_02515 [Fimbriimonadia bacterium]